MTDTTFVIVGAGLAGAKAAETLRAEGFDGRVVLAGAEDARPYERPPLSKAYLASTDETEGPFVHDASFYDDNAIELRTCSTVRSLDLGARTVTLAGETLRYDRLLLATGTRARRLPVPGADLPGVYYLRTLADADALRDSAATAENVVVIGAGWIGSEVAASLRQRGLAVTLVDPAPLPLLRVLGPELGIVYRDLHAAHGVRLALGVGVTALHGDTRVRRVELADGRTLDADLVVVGVGVTPRDELANDAGLAVDNGIVVDRFLRTSDPAVYAAGDVANAFHPTLATRLRVEHWANALNQGIAVAKNMLGAETTYDRLPYFYSDQYDLGMEYRGHATEWDRVVFRGDPRTGTFCAFWLRDGRVAAAMNANSWDAGDDLQRLVAERRPVDPAELADENMPLARKVPA
jgi:3-phenylpropionate/trans-cinnamate dioxygenase ferredoxin reductase subunit